MPNLTVVLDSVANLRQAMPAHGPDPTAAAVIARLAGAGGIAMHLREDRHFAQERDVRLIREVIDGPMILHIAAVSEMVGFALDVKPERVVLVPEIGDEPSNEAGLDLIVQGRGIFESVGALQAAGISVAVCIAPDPEQVKLAHQLRAAWVQIHAGRLLAAASPTARRQELDRVIDTVKMAHKLRLHIAVGHGLNFDLLKLFKGLPEIDEFSIGRSLIARALFSGLERAVKDTIDLIRTL